MCLTFLCIHSLSAPAYGLYSLTLLPAGVAAGLIGGLSAQACCVMGTTWQRQSCVVACWASIGREPVVCRWCWLPGWSVGLYAGVFLPSPRFLCGLDGHTAQPVRGTRSARSVLALTCCALSQPWSWCGCCCKAGGAAAVLCWPRRFLSWLSGGGATQDPIATQAGTRRVEPPLPELRPVVCRLAGGDRVISLAERSVVESVSGMAASGRYAAQADVVNAIFSATGGPWRLHDAELSAMTGPACADAERLLRLGLLGTAATGALCVALGVGLSALGTGRIADALTGDPRTALMLVAAGAVWTAAGFVQKPLELRGRPGSLWGGGVVAAVLLATAPWLARSFGRSAWRVKLLAAWCSCCWCRLRRAA